MNVGIAAARTGLPAKTIRYYEDIGLVRPDRASNGYRAYSEDDIDSLTFLKRARRLGFSIGECRQLIALQRDRTRASHDVRAIASRHLGSIDAKIRELEAMRDTLGELVEACHGDTQPTCAILDGMAGVRRPRRSSAADPEKLI